MDEERRRFNFTLPIYWQQTKSKRVLVGLNWYRNAHYFILNKAKKYFHNLVEEACAGQQPFDGKVRVEYKIYLKNKLSDGGNVRSVIEKFALDGLVSAWMIKQDRAVIVSEDGSEYGFDKENPRAEITIIDNE